MGKLLLFTEYTAPAHRRTVFMVCCEKKREISLWFVVVFFFFFKRRANFNLTGRAKNINIPGLNYYAALNRTNDYY